VTTSGGVPRDAPTHCKGRVPGVWRDSACSRKAVRDGYCNTHHPESVKARRAKSEQRYQDRRIAEAQERNRRARETADAFLGHVKGQVPRALWSHLVHAVEKWDREEIGRVSGDAGGGEQPSA
jgi:hypothetical protein